jgi:hypothetical protein
VELVYVTVIAAGIGLALRYMLPGRDAYGLLLLPAVSAAVTSALWAGLTWLDWPFDGGWIWVVTLVAGGLAAIAVALLVPWARRTADARRLHQLSGGRA